MKLFFLVVGILFWLNVEAGQLPDSTLTPGVTRDLSLEQICSTKWGKDVRAVTAAMKASVYRSYGMIPYKGDCALSTQGCEIDHLISRELGGADDVKNLWPQPYGGSCNAHQKDHLENVLHGLVCSGKFSLQDAQKQIATDWILAFSKYVDSKGCK
jgi:hypothetical protein